MTFINDLQNHINSVNYADETAEQLELFTAELSHFVADLEENKTEALLEHDEDRYDNLSDLQLEVEIALETGDYQRARELNEIKLAYTQ